MLRKSIAMLVFIAITASIMTLPVYAHGESIYSDYEPGAMPENMFRTDRELRLEEGMAGGFIDCACPTCPQDNKPRIAAVKEGSSYILTANDKSYNGAEYKYAYGLYFDNRAIRSNNVNSTTGAPIKGDIACCKNYVYSMQIRNLNPNIIPNVHVRLYDADNTGVFHSKEYGSSGMAITGADWIDLKCTIANSDDFSNTHNESNIDQLSIGFPNSSTLARSSVEINFADSGETMHRPYFAEEAAYDITNTLDAGSLTLEDGGAAVFKAEVVNQVGLPGFLNQEFTWMVMNKERTTEADGFIITRGEDGIAEIKVNGAKPGAYDVVAYSAEYKMAKGIAITVRGEEVTNISVDNSAAGQFTLKAVDVVKSGAEKILVVAASFTNAEGIKKIEDVERAELTVVDGDASLEDSITIDAPVGCDVRVFVWNAANLAPISLAEGVTAEYKIS